VIRMVCDGGMRPRSMAPIRRPTNRSFAGPHGYLRPNLRNLAAESGRPDRVMIDGTHLKALGQPPVCSKGGFHPVSSARTKGRLNSSYTRFAMALAGQLSFFSQRTNGDIRARL